MGKDLQEIQTIQLKTKTRGNKEKDGGGECACITNVLVETNLEWSQGYSLTSLRPMTTYKMVNGGVSIQ